MTSNYPITEEIKSLSELVRLSVLFDMDFYLRQTPRTVTQADAAVHYLLEGEAAGLLPSRAFDPTVYGQLHPDVAAAGVNRLVHFEISGRQEGRRIAFSVDTLHLESIAVDPGKPTVILLLHEATYSGAPLLGWNLIGELKLTRNVIVVLRRGGDLVPALDEAATALIGPLPSDAADNPMELAHLARRLKSVYGPLYAIACSVETRLVATALANCDVPVIALVHEFATHSAPHALEQFYKACDTLVFAADLVEQSSIDNYEFLRLQNTRILPQGPSKIPRLRRGFEDCERPDAGGVLSSNTELDILLSADSDHFTVLGLGTIDLRKGVDLFIATATALLARAPDLKVRFLWLGSRIFPLPNQYYTMLDEQISRSGLADKIHLLDATDDLERIYAAADVLLLTSRLDPMPNVAIDAALKGVPVLCFDKATGFAELLERDPTTEMLVAPHLDIGRIAEAVAVLATDAVAYEGAATGIRAMARSTFNMLRYVQAIDRLGKSAAGKLEAARHQIPLLVDEEEFDPGLCLGSSDEPLSRADAAWRYLKGVMNVNFSRPAVWGVHFRPPLAGFHPLLYGEHAEDFPRDGSINPLVHYLAKGKPRGPWRHPVITLSSDGSTPGKASQLKTALHGHFHYPDNIARFVEAVSVNASPVDLFLTTTSEDAADILRAATQGYVLGEIRIDVVANVGRDIGPFIRLLEGPLKYYDVVGHLHGKRSAHTFHYDSELGNRWREFLWQHLLGPAAPVADIILDHFGRDARLGMVFPENDFLVGWEKNREFAEGLAARVGLTALPEHFVFPVGTMFWARPAALQGLVAAGFTDAEYPQEPLPIDGSMLHALERMLPILAEEAGFGYVTTRFPQFKR